MNDIQHRKTEKSHNFLLHTSALFSTAAITAIFIYALISFFTHVPTPLPAPGEELNFPKSVYSSTLTSSVRGRTLLHYEPDLVLTTFDIFDGPIPINTASTQELDIIPGIGPSKAEAIVAFRDVSGPIRNETQLDRVPGFGPKTIEGLRPFITFEGPSPRGKRP